MSKRFGPPKQLARLGSKPLLEWVLDSALASRLDKIVLVLGHAHSKIQQALDAKINHARIQTVINERYAAGQSGSLHAGLSRVHQDFDSVMFILGDQPRLRSNTIDLLLEKYWSSAKRICVPVYRGKRGNPVIFSQTLYGKLKAIEGDIGAREVIRTNQEHVLYVELDDPLCFTDIDSPQDLENLQKIFLNPDGFEGDESI